MSEGTLQEQVTARTMKDPIFRQALILNATDTLAREYDFHPSEQVTIRVLEEASNTFTLVLPAVEKARLELTDADLDAVSGGQSAGVSHPGPSH